MVPVSAMVNLKWLARRLLADYSLYRIYEFPLEACTPPPTSHYRFIDISNGQALTASGDPCLRELSEYAGRDAHGFALCLHGEIAAACWFWSRERYQERAFWPIKSNEAKLVQITTNSQLRGRGFASALLAFASFQMKQLGYKRLFARVWHSNRASIATFSKAGWKEIAFVLELRPWGTHRSFRYVHKNRSVLI